MGVLKNKNVVLVGASSGIGAAMAKYFAQNGANVFISARREERLKAIADEMSKDNFVVKYTKCDATDYNQVADMAKKAYEAFGEFDVWINCTGQNKAIGKMWEIPMEDLWEEVSVDLKSTMIGTHIAINYMKKVDSGLILNFCGGGTDNPHVYAAAYSTAKAGIARFTESVFLELEKDNSNIKIVCTNPGLVHNERTQLLCEEENSLKYMPEIKVAFESGKGQSPLVTAYLIEAVLEGKLDNYNGRLVVGPNLKETIANGKASKDNLIGLLRIIH